MPLSSLFADALSSASSSSSSSAAASSSKSSAPSSSVAVIGGTGRLGRRTVQLLLDQGTHCHLLVRQHHHQNQNQNQHNIPKASLEDCESSGEVATYFQSHYPEQVTIYRGDVGDTQALQALVKDCTACLAVWGSTRKSKVSDLWNFSKLQNGVDPTYAKQVNYEGVRRLIEVCEAPTSTCRRIVRITGKGESPNAPISILINLLGSMAKAWNYEGEQALRASKLDYTIIRPGAMTESSSSSNLDEKKSSLVLADNGAAIPTTRIEYQDIAALCVECLEYPNTARCTLTAMTTTTTETNDDKHDESLETSTSTATATDAATSWGPLLATVQADRRSFPSDMLEQHHAAVRKTLIRMGGIFSLVFAIVIKVAFFGEK